MRIRQILPKTPFALAPPAPGRLSLLLPSLLAFLLASAAFPAHGQTTETWNPNGNFTGGNGTWDTGVSQDWDSGFTWTGGNDALFSGIGGSVTLVSATANALTFSATGIYVLSSGTLTLDGPDVTVDSDASIGSTVTAAGGMFVTGSGTLTLTGTASLGSNVLEVDSGTVAVSAGGYVTGQAGIGYDSGSNGSVTVSGSGSTWTSSSNFYVGDSGTGSLVISNGGSVSDQGGAIGYQGGSSGTVTVTGSGSQWTNGPTLYVGNSGAGTLAISNGALVSASNITIGSAGTLALGQNPTLSGNLLVQAGGTVTLVDGQTHTVTLTGTFATGSTIDLELSSNGFASDELTVTGVFKTNVNLFCDSGIIVSGTRGLLTDDSGLTVTLGNVYNPGNILYTLEDYAVTQELVVSTPADNPLTTAYWTGAQDNVWSIAVNGTATNWSTNSAGTNDPHLTPSATTDVIFSASNAVSQSNTVLGFDMTIDSLTVSDTNAVSISGSDSQPLLPNNDTLTIADSNSGGNAIAVNAGAGQVTIGANLTLSGSSQTIAVNNAAGLLITGTLGGSGMTLSGTGTVTLAGPGNLGSGTVDVEQGTLTIQNSLSNGTAEIGNNAASDGSVTVSGTWATGNPVIGNNSSSDGAVTISGTGALWTISGGFTIGNSGTGTLTISNGGSVSGSGATIGNASDSASVTVTGTGSIWTNNGALTVGRSASAASLTIYAGGYVSDTGATIGAFGRQQNNVTVTGSGSAWSNTGTLTIANVGAAGTLTISGGGAVTDTGATIADTSNPDGASVTVTGTGSTWTNTGEVNLGAGSRGGTLTISGGGAVTDTSADIGVLSHYSNTVTVSGAGSTWTNTGSVTIGDDGEAAIMISGGGALSDTSAVIGLNVLMGYTFSATVSGSGSQWTNSGGLTIGAGGVGSLAISSGASVSDSTGIIGQSQHSPNAGTPSTVTVSGSGGTGTWSNSGDLYVGDSGFGTLAISSGGTVSSSNGWVGYASSGTGAVTVDGTGSQWNLSGGLYLGESGAASLVISDGGAVSVSGQGPDGTLASGELYVGGTGSGTLSISSGAEVSNSDAWIGYEANSSGAARVSGSGASWTNSGALIVGGSGSGTLAITNGGSVSASKTIIGSAGTLALGQNATVSGSMAVQGGTVTLVDGQLHTATVNTLDSNLQGGSNLDFEVGAGSDELASTQNVFCDLPTIINLYGLSGQITSGTDVLISALSVGGVTPALGNVYNTGNFTYALQDTGASEEVIVTAAAIPLTTAYWTGANGNVWSVSNTIFGPTTNWSTDPAGLNDPGLTPSATTDVIFSATGAANQSNTVLGADMTIDSLTIDDTNAVSISGSDSQPLLPNNDTLTVTDSNSGGNAIAVNSGAGQVTIGANLELDGSSQNVAVNNAAGLLLTGTIGGTGMTLTGSGTVTLAGSGDFGGNTVSVANGTLAVTGSLTGNGLVAASPGGTANATVSGPGALWTANDQLVVGQSGSAGTLLITNGGEVSILYGGQADVGNGTGASGSIAITGTGSTLAIGANANIYIGNSGGAGALSVTGGGTISSNGASNDFYIGNGAGSSGSLTVSGSGSSITTLLESQLDIGENGGAGTMLVTNGGTVTAYRANVYNGTLTVSGSESSFSTEELKIGGGVGNGVLMVTNGGNVTAPNSLLSNGGTMAFGGNLALDIGFTAYGGTITLVDGQLHTVTLTEQGSEIDENTNLDFDVGNGSDEIVFSNYLHVSTSPTVNLYGISGAVTTGTDALIGANLVTQAVPSLGNVYNGGNFTYALQYNGGTVSENVVIASAATPLTTAYWQGGQGNLWSLSVGGTASSWTTDSAGMQVSALTPSATTDVIFSATGASNESNTVLGTDMTIDSLTVSDTNAVSISGSDSNPLVPNNDTLTITDSNSGGNAIAVNAGAGQVTIGANLELDGTSQNVAVDNAAGLLLTGTVDGAGMTLTGSGTVTLAGSGDFGGNTVTVANGTLAVTGSLTGNGLVAASPGGTANATVSGPGALWTASNQLVVGQSGSAGTLLITNGGTVSADGANVYNGTLTVSGSGSSFITRDIEIGGGGGNGVLVVTNGGNVTAPVLKLYNGGTMAFGGNLALDIRVSAIGGTITLVDGQLHTVTLTAGGSEIDGNANFDFDVGNGSDEVVFPNQLGIVDSPIVNLYGISGAVTTGTDALIGNVSFITQAVPSLGIVYNGGNFTYALEDTGISENVIVSAATTPLTTAYWQGGQGNVWSLSVGGTASSWTTDSAGTLVSALTPSATTDVIFSATGAANESNTVLDTDVTIDSLTINDPNAVGISGSDSNPLVPDNDTLTITDSNSGGNAIAVNSGAGLVTIGANLELDGSSQNVAVDNAAGLLLTGTVDGAGMTLTGSGTVTLAGSGDFGGNTVSVANGTLAVTGTLTGNGLVAASPGGTANATVSGPGALWTASNQLVVGQSGSAGTLLITNGGEVSIAGSNNGGAAYIGNGTGASGSMAITGTGSTLAISGIGSVYIGNSGGAGALSVTGGGTISINDLGNDFYIGNGAGSSGSLIVSGSGSSFTLYGSLLEIGENGGAGTMSITNGGTVKTQIEQVDNGTLTVTGSGSELNVLGSIYVGINGLGGTLVVTNGGNVTAQILALHNGGTMAFGGNLALDFGFNASGGTITLVDGQLHTVTLTALSDIDGKANLDFDVGNGSDEIVFPNHLGVYTSPIVNLYGISGAVTTGTDALIGNLTFMTQAVPSLGNVYNGGNFTYALQYNGGAESENVVIASAATPLTTAYWQGGQGNLWSLSVGGTASSWTTDSAGTQVSALTPSATTDVIFSASNAVNQSYTVLGTDMTIDSLTVSDTNAVSISGSDTDPLVPDNDTLTITDSNAGGNAIAVNSGAGAVTIGANVALGGASQSVVVNNAGGLLLTGTLTGPALTLSGTGTLTAQGPGAFGGGTVDVEGGTLAIENSFSNGAGAIGYQAGSNGAVTVSGSGAQWTNGGDLFVGGSGSGALAISSGGLVSNGNGWIGYAGAGIGVVTVDGSGTIWSNADTLSVGGSGSGSLAISSGATVSSQYTLIGDKAGSNGAVTVDGATSSLTASLDVYVADSGIGMLAVKNSAQVNASGDIYIGDSGTGTLTVSSGGSLSNGYFSIGGVIGNNAGSAGSVTVDGAGSSWTDESNFYVGNSGSGALTVSHGATLGNGYKTTGARAGKEIGAVIGNYGGSIGSVTIDGAGSSWTDSGDLYIANSGSGSMTVSNGGYVENGLLLLGASIAQNPGSIGSVTVTGSNSTWSDDGDLYVGNSGAGALTISNGGSVSDNNARIAYSAGSSGAVTVDGSASTWTNNGSLLVGGSGAGTVLISNGGTVSADSGQIGGATGSSGTVTVTGTGSELIANGIEVSTGAGGTGALIVTDGGAVAFSPPDSMNDVINVNASGTLALGEDAAIGMPVSVNGGTVTLVDGQLETVPIAATVNAGSTLDFEVGNGSDQLSVPAGPAAFTVSGASLVNLYGLSGQITSGTDVIIGASPSFSGGTLSLGNVYNTGNFTYALEDTGTSEDVIVTAAAAPLTTAYWTGAQGNVWSVAIGGTATNWSTDPAGANDPGLTPSATTDVIFSATGAASQSDTLLGADMTIDSLTISDTNTVSISGSDSQPILPNNDTLTITDSNSGGNAIAVNTGAGQVIIGANLMLGGSSQNVAVDNAAGLLFTGTLGGTGMTLYGTGTLTLTGAGSFGGGTVDVETGTLAVSNGGALADTNGEIGYNAGSNGAVAVSGSGSTWTNSGDLYIGGSGTGIMAISSGGSVLDNNGWIGYAAGSSGVVKVDGSGSTWTSSGNLTVGNNGTGTLAITNGGTVSSGGFILNTGGTLALGENPVLSSSNSLSLDGGTVSLVDGKVQTVTINPEASDGDSPVTFDFEVGNGSDDIVFTKLGLGNHSVLNLYCLSGAVTAGTDVLIENFGLTKNRMMGQPPAASFSLGNVYNTGNFNYSLRSRSDYGDSDEYVIVTATTPLTAAYWKGGQNNIWSVLVGGTATNWTTDAAGTVDPLLTPSATTNVIFSASNAVNQSNTVLGTDMTIDSLTVSDTNAVVISGSDSQPLMPDNDTLTITGNAAIAVKSGAGQVTIGANLSLDGSNQTVAVSNAAGLLLTGTVGGTDGLAKSGTGALTLAGPSAFGAETVDIEHGTLAIEDSLTNGAGLIGNQAGSNGTVTLSGSGSSWTNSLNLTIGNGGAGTLAVTDGALLNVTGTTTLDSFGTLQFDNTAALNTGSLVLNGGTLVTLSAVTFANSASVQTGGMYVNTESFDSTFTGDFTGPGRFVDSGAGLLTLTGSDSFGLNTLIFGTGGIQVTGGGFLSDVSGAIGAGGSNTATVSGTGSVWTNSGDLFVGYSGTGGLTVTGGGVLSTAVNSYIAFNPGSNGTATISGGGSQWTTTDNFFVANSGTGALGISGGGSVLTDGVSYIALNPGSNGTATISGSGSQWTTTGNFAVADSGTGALGISDGGSVLTDGVAYIGLNAGSNGSVTLSGTRSTWSILHNLAVAYSGTGTLAITGGLVSASNSFIGYSAGSNGTVTVSASGADLNSTGSLTVGDSGAGALSITGGGSVSAANGYIGLSASSDGMVNVSGSGSIWTTGAALTVGDAGSGTLSIAGAGSVLTGANGYIGLSASSTGLVNVSDTGSIWTLQGDLAAGYSGGGSLEIADGGEVLSDLPAFLGYSAGSIGSVTLSGSGSTWTTVRNFAIGYSGTGSLAISSGGNLTSEGEDFIGFFAGSDGTVSVAGPGATWTNEENLVIGDLGEGALSITGSGSVSVTGSTTIGSTGSLAVGSDATFNTGSLAVNGGTLEALGNATFGSSATLGGPGMKINANGFSSTFSGNFSGTGGIALSGSGTVTLTGASTYTGATLVKSGTLTLMTTSAQTASLGNTAINVAAGATFSASLGASPFSKTVVAGTTSPGAAGATLTLAPGSVFSLAGNALATFNLQQQTSFSGHAFTIGGASGIAPTLIFDIGNAASGTDLINVTGLVSVQHTGGVIVIDPLAGDTTLTPGNYDLITSATGGFTSVNGNGLTLSGTTLVVDDATYDLSLADSTGKDEILTVSAATPSTPSSLLAAPSAIPADRTATPLISTAAVPEPGATASLLTASALIAATLLRRRKCAKPPIS